MIPEYWVPVSLRLNMTVLVAEHSCRARQISLWMVGYLDMRACVAKFWGYCTIFEVISIIDRVFIGRLVPRTRKQTASYRNPSML
jgi:hypothetical protein